MISPLREPPRQRSAALRQLAILAVVACAMLASSRTVLAVAEPYEQFLAALRPRGYGTLAVHYLNSIKDKPDLPQPLREIWDLEMARSLRLAADEQRDRATREQLLTAAQRHQAKFDEEHPDHPALAATHNETGSQKLDRGIRDVRLAQNARDPEVRTRMLQHARSRLDEAQADFAAASAVSKPEEANAATADTAQFELAEAQTKSALADYWRVQLDELAEANAPEPKNSRLRAIATRLGEVASNVRGSPASWVAQYWQAKLVAELGDNETALDLCDEVLDFAPVPPEPPGSPGQQQFFADTLVLRWQVLRASNSAEHIAEEAEEWLKAHPDSEQTAFRGLIQYELGQARLADAEKVLGAPRRHAQIAAVKVLSQAAGIPGSYQVDALKLEERWLRELNLEPRKSAVLTLADAQTKALQWSDAETAYEQLLAASKAGDAAQADSIATALGKLWLLEARVWNEESDAEMTVRLAQRAIERLPRADATRQLAFLALNAAACKAKEDASFDREKLAGLIKYLSDTWPASEESENAVLALAQLDLASGQLEEGLAKLKSLKPAAPRFASVMAYGADQAWKARALDLRKPADQQDKTLQKRLFDTAAEFATASLQAQGESTSDQAIGVRTLLARIELERQQASAAVRALEPLVAPARLAALPAPQALMVGTLAIRALGATGDQEQAIAVAMALAQRAADDTASNEALLGVLTQIVGSRPQDNSATPAPFPPQASEIYRSLSARNRLSPKCHLGLGLIGPALGEPVLARAHLESAIEAAPSDPELQGPLKAQTQQARMRLVELLLAEKNYDRALYHLNRLLADYKNSPRVLLMKARALHEWSQADEQKLAEAVEQWTTVRLALASRSEYRNEYFESVYGAAERLVRRAEVENNLELVRQANTLLDATLITAPQLSGPDEVARYRELQQKIAARLDAAPQDK